MFTPNPHPPRVGYYLAVALFLAILVFAVLGLVRASSVIGAGSPRPAITPRLVPTRTRIAGLPVPTAQIPPPTPYEPTRPPSVTYLYPPPEESAAAEPEVRAQPRR
jgi:hypothetical protein